MDERFFLEKLSPLVAARRDCVYPAMLITTRKKDTRVAPMNSYKCAAALQDHQAGDAPILLRVDEVGGHAVESMPMPMRIEYLADLYAFAWDVGGKGKRAPGGGQPVASMAVSLLDWHLDEAGFMWTQREAAARAPHYDLASLGGLDERLEAQLDALRLGGAAAWELCRAALDDLSDGVLFTTASVALASGLEQVATVLEIAEGSVSRESELVAALGWAPIEQARPILARLLAADVPPALRRVGLAATAARRVDPGPVLDQALAGSDPRLAAAAAEAAGVLGDPRRADAVRGMLATSAPEGRIAAAWSGALLGDTAAHAILPELALGAQSPGGIEEACELTALIEPLGGAARDLARLPPRMAARYAGASGDVRHIPWLLDRVADPSLARVAGEAMAMITGADLSRAPLRGTRPEAQAEVPGEDPLDPRVAMDPDEDLPWPAPAAVTAWWAEHTALHAAPERFLCGKPHSDEWLLAVLQRGRQRERAVAALALKLRRPGRPLFHVRAPAPRQARALGVTL